MHSSFNFRKAFEFRNNDAFFFVARCIWTNGSFIPSLNKFEVNVGRTSRLLTCWLVIRYSSFVYDDTICAPKSWTSDSL